MLVAAFVTTKSFGQGAISLSNFGNGGSIGDTPIVEADGVTLAVTFFAQILAGPSAGSLAPVGSYPSGTPTTFTQNSGPGFFDFSTGVVPGVSGSAFFQVIAWKGGATFATATFRGSSPVFSNVTGTNPSSGPPPTTGSPTTLDIPGANIKLAAVPEPSTIVLSLLGVGALFLRRKRSA